MENISSFLERFKNLLSSHGVARQIVVDAIQQELGVSIQKENITMKGGVAYIQASPTLKNQLFLKKAAILKRVGALGSQVSDIR